MEDIVVPTQNKNHNKRKIIWTVLTIIAIGLATYAIVQKYRVNKNIDRQSEAEKKVLQKLEEISPKDINNDPGVEEPILDKLESISPKGEIKTEEQKQKEIEVMERLRQ